MCPTRRHEEFYSLAQQRHFYLDGYPVTINSGDIFFAEIQLKSATSCAAWAAFKGAKMLIFEGKLWHHIYVSLR